MQNNNEDGFNIGFQSSSPFGQTLNQQSSYPTQPYQTPTHNIYGYPLSTSSSISTNRTGSMASQNFPMAFSQGRYGSGMYGSQMMNNGLDLTHSMLNSSAFNFGEDDLNMATFSGMDFTNPFENTYPVPQGNNYNGSSG